MSELPDRIEVLVDPTECPWPLSDMWIWAGIKLQEAGVPLTVGIISNKVNSGVLTRCDDVRDFSKMRFVWEKGLVDE